MVAADLDRFAFGAPVALDELAYARVAILSSTPPGTSAEVILRSYRGREESVEIDVRLPDGSRISRSLAVAPEVPQ